MWSGKDWVVPWTWVCFLLWVGLTLVVYQLVLDPAEWFQQAGVGRLVLMLLNLWATELVVAILWIGVSLLLVSFEDDKPTKEEEKREADCLAT